MAFGQKCQRSDAALREMLKKSEEIDVSVKVEPELCEAFELEVKVTA